MIWQLVKPLVELSMDPDLRRAFPCIPNTVTWLFVDPHDCAILKFAVALTLILVNVPSKYNRNVPTANDLLVSRILRCIRVPPAKTNSFYAVSWMARSPYASCR